MSEILDSFKDVVNVRHNGKILQCLMGTDFGPYVEKSASFLFCQLQSYV